MAHTGFNRAKRYVQGLRYFIHCKPFEIRQVDDCIIFGVKFCYHGFKAYSICGLLRSHTTAANVIYDIFTRMDFAFHYFAFGAKFVDSGITGYIYHPGVYPATGGIVSADIVPYLYEDFLKYILGNLFVEDYFGNNAIENGRILLVQVVESFPALLF